MELELRLAETMSGTRHEFYFEGDSERGEYWPEKMVQGSETYRLRWEEVPEPIQETVEDLFRLERVER